MYNYYLETNIRNQIYVDYYLIMNSEYFKFHIEPAKNVFKKEERNSKVRCTFSNPFSDCFGVISFLNNCKFYS